MEIIWDTTAQKHLLYWKNNKTIQKRINILIYAIIDNPFTGIGKPEALKHEMSGFLSRRINDEHRLIYSVDEKKKIITIYSLKGHY